MRMLSHQYVRSPDLLRRHVSTARRREMDLRIRIRFHASWKGGIGFYRGTFGGSKPQLEAYIGAKIPLHFFGASC